MKRKIFLYLSVALEAIICLSAISQAAPARKCLIAYTQPDGSTFRGYVRGDEFCHYRTTEAGDIIAKNKEGWWCYASYDADGNINISGARVSASNTAVSKFYTKNRQQFYPGVSERRLMFDENIARKPMMRNFLDMGGAATKSGVAARQKHGIIILAAFKDVPFRYSREYFVNMLTQKGYSYNGATGSAIDYFNDQFGGLVDFSFDVSEVVTLPEKRVYYGGNDDYDNDQNPEQMIIDACKLASQNGTDFSKYDDDNDGYVDNVFVFFAGEDEADTENEDCIWSHAYFIESGAKKKLTLNGKKIDSYACTSELSPEYIVRDGKYYLTGKYFLSGIGTFCHEYSHTFGLPDLYDTDYEKSGGQAEALWQSTGLMDGGNTNNDGNTPPFYNAIDRECLGISEPVMLTDGVHEIEPINRNGVYYRIDTPTEDEYFLIECRENTSWDKYIGGKGLLVYHIDKSNNAAGKSDNYGKVMTARERWEYYNEVNCRPDRQCADLIEANPNMAGSFDQTKSQIGKIFFPNEEYDNLSSSNGLRYWNENEECTAELSGITLLENGRARLTVSGIGTVIMKDVFQNTAILTIWDDRAQGDINVKFAGEEFSVSSHERGKYSLRLEGLEGGTAYTVTITIGDKSSTISFTTSKTGDSIPRIAFSSRGRYIDGSFSSGAGLPLIVENVAIGDATSWYLDNKEIKVEKSNYYTIRKSGFLKAVVHHADGSETTIRKRIIVR